MGRKDRWTGGEQPPVSDKARHHAGSLLAQAWLCPPSASSSPGWAWRVEQKEAQASFPFQSHPRVLSFPFQLYLRVLGWGRCKIVPDEEGGGKLEGSLLMNLKLK
jgi:hypothetical protein